MTDGYLYADKPATAALLEITWFSIIYSMRATSRHSRLAGAPCGQE